jgi:hypothetical protein
MAGCLALRSAGYDVSVICPKGPGDSTRETLEGVDIYTYAPPPEAKSLLRYVFEFAYCWLRTALLSLAVRRRRPFQVLQACNPPDTCWLLARLWRLRGVRLVYDQHDLNPELFLSRFGEPSGFASTAQFRGLRWLERMTYRTADEIVSTNESHRSKALGRGRVAPEHATVVRSGPDTARMRPVTTTMDPGSDKRVLAYQGDHGLAGRRGHGAARPPTAARRSWAHGRAGSALGLRRLSRRPTCREHALGAGRHRDLHRTGRTRRKLLATSAPPTSGCALTPRPR